MFSNRDLRKLLIPLVVEQILNSLMGTADSIMVSNVGPAAISAVSLVDSINILVIQAFYALAAGGAIICSQYIGQGDHKNAGRSANQLVFVVTVISAAVTAACLAFRMPLLKLISISSLQHYHFRLLRSMMRALRFTGHRGIQSCP